jgi:hypothetical protein
MNNNELNNDFIIKKTRAEGNCAIHSILLGLQMFYSNDDIIQIINQYLDDEEQISEICLVKDKHKLEFSVETTNAIRNMLYNYYTDNQTQISEDMQLPYRPGENNTPQWIKIKEDKAFLTTNDLHYITKIFDICIKLRTKQGNQNVWMFIDSSSDAPGWSENNCMNKKIIYMHHINNNHFDLLIPKADRSKYESLESIKGYNSKNRSTRKNSFKKSLPPQNNSLHNKTIKNPFKKLSSKQNNTRKIKNRFKKQTNSEYIYGGLAVTGIVSGLLFVLTII